MRAMTRKRLAMTTNDDALVVFYLIVELLLLLIVLRLLHLLHLLVMLGDVLRRREVAPASLRGRGRRGGHRTRCSR